MSTLDRRAFLAAAGAAAAIPSLACARETEAWTPRASLSWPVQEIYAAVHQGRIVIGGGLVARQGQPLHIEDRVGLYDPATDSWSDLPRLPSPRHHPMVFASDDDLFVFGGYGRSAAGEWTSMRDCWVLHEGAWVETVPLDAPQSETGGVSPDGRLHLITGRTPGGPANGQWNDQADTDAHRVYITGVDVWDTAKPCPMARYSAAAAVLDGAIWVAGGRTVSGGGTGRLDRYDPTADRWDTLAPIPPSPATGQQVGGGLAMAAAGGKLVAFGGEWFQRGGGGGVFAETWLYDPATDRWERGPDMRTPRHGLAAAAVDGVVYAIAGGELVSGGRAGGVVEALVT